MEEKRKDAGTPPPVASVFESPVAEATTSSRRRGGGQKRKATAIGSSNALTPPTASSSKRQAREKPPPVPFTPIHNGPLTRARQQPNNSAPAAVKIDGELRGGETFKSDEVLNEAAKEDWEALGAKIEAEYEAIRSRDTNVHVVPNHAGWFSWTKIHPLEEKILSSFFNGKLENRTPEIYMEVRNCIMKKFHANPNAQIELKDLTEMSVGELEARQEVMDFLDYWGLINYHPFPKIDPTGMSIEGKADTAVKTDSLVENLFRFESDQPCTPDVPRNSVATPAAPSGLFPESAISEELVKSEGVEYHCNSCSADCSRKRYHCQKQADFDLCTECFNNGKFGSDMSPSDFILMEPAEAGGASSGKWTDQETLLLLEALELFKENWNEIAEHVATKTKAQCILHFVQMPIEDTFLDSGGENADATKENADAAKENADAVQINHENLATKDAAEMTENKGSANDNQTSSSPIENSKPEEVNESNGHEVGENFVLKALKESFEAVGSLSSPIERLSFAEAGNPVMALVAFLLRVVEPNVITASARSSLKSISGNSSGEQLAARHCFRLEDPPDQKKSTNSGRTTSGLVEETEIDEGRNVEEQKDKSNLAVDGINASNGEGNDSGKDHVMGEDKSVVSPSNACVDESTSSKETDQTSTHKDSNLSGAKKPDSAGVPMRTEPGTAINSDDLTVEAEVPPGFEKDPDDEAPVGESSKSAEAPSDKDPTLNSQEQNPGEPAASNSVRENGSKEGVEAEDCLDEDKEGLKSENDLEVSKIRKAAVTAVSAAAVKAKLLAAQEEKQIQHLAALLIEKQLHKLEIKLAFFHEMESMVLRVREQLERSKQRLFHERAQIIAARLGMSGSRPMQQSLPVNRAAMAFAHLAPRPNIGLSNPRPPISKPMMATNPVSTSIAGTPVQPSNQDQFSSVSTK